MQRSKSLRLEKKKKSNDCLKRAEAKKTSEDERESEFEKKRRN